MPNDNPMTGILPAWADKVVMEQLDIEMIGMEQKVEDNHLF